MKRQQDKNNKLLTVSATRRRKENGEMIKLHTHNGEHFVVIANQVWKFKRIESAWQFIFGIVRIDQTKEKDNEQ